MEIINRREGETAIVEILGRLDTVTAPRFDSQFPTVAADARNCVLLLDRLEYLSSAGLRSILMASKLMHARSGRLVLTGLRGTVEEVFAVSGFAQFLRVLPSEAAALTELS